ncbi:MAG: hypothetical protein ACK54H_04175, partial [Phycisphaerales bacterium]
AKRGVLSPDEIHRLASTTKKAMGNGKQTASAGDDDAKLSCHSDYVDPETAKRMHAQTLVQLDVRPALGIAKEDRVV